MRCLKSFVIMFLFIQFLHAQTTDFSGMSFCFDPGHGYHGNPGVYGYSEAEKNLRVALYCLDYFSAMNADTVISTRYSDNEDPSLSQREAIANNAGVTWFHSIHSNAGSWWINNVLVLYEEKRDWNQLCPGSTSNYMGLGYAEWQGQSDVMGDIDSDWIARGFRIPSLGGFLDWTFYGGCTSGHSLGVLNDLTMPGELSEAGYHTNPTQNLLCMNTDWKRIQARAHLESFKQYFGIDHSGFNTITGIIRDEDTQKPLNGVTVTLNDINGNPLAEYTTDTFESLFHNWCTQGDSCSNGFYIFENCTADSYMITVQLPFYYSDTVITAVEDTQWTFVDRELISSLPPRVTWSSPSLNDTSVSVNADWKIRFSRRMDTEAVMANITIEPSVEGLFYWERNNHQLVFDPQRVLDFNTTYTLTISEGASDLFGHFIDGNSDSTGGDPYVLSFKTASTDRFPPVMEEMFPPLAGNEIHPYQPVNFLFNEPLDETSIGNDRFLWTTSDQDEISFKVDYHIIHGRGAVSLLQNNPLPEDPSLQVDIFAGITDLFGNSSSEYQSFTFSCGGQVPDFTILEDFSDKNDWEGDVSFISLQDSVLLPIIGDSGGAFISFPPDTTLEFRYTGDYTGLANPVVFMPIFSDGNGCEIQVLFSETQGTGEASPWIKLNQTGWGMLEFDPLSDSLGVWDEFSNDTIEGNLSFYGLRINSSEARYPENSLFIDDILIYSSPQSISPYNSKLPDKFNLGQNYPNPFNASTTIPLYLPERFFVSLRVFDISGRFVRILREGELPRGLNEISWNGKDQYDRPVPSGIYFIRMEATDANSGKKEILLIRSLLLK